MKNSHGFSYNFTKSASAPEIDALTIPSIYMYNIGVTFIRIQEDTP